MVHDIFLDDGNDDSDTEPAPARVQ